MDRLIFQNIDFNHKPLSAEQRKVSRKAKGKKIPRDADSYRGAKRNSRPRYLRSNPSVGGAYRGDLCRDLSGRTRSLAIQP